ncbi:MAG: hypothetical protein ABH833_04380 [Parcubacteria group bacterium]
MQVIMTATTATTVAYGTAITSSNCHPLPAWAPPIQYIGTTSPWEVIFVKVTTGDITGAEGHQNRKVKVRTYGRKAQLYEGREVVALRSRVETTTARKPLMIVTYRAIGEIVRP